MVEHERTRQSVPILAIPIQNIAQDVETQFLKLTELERGLVFLLETSEPLNAYAIKTRVWETLKQRKNLDLAYKNLVAEESVIKTTTKTKDAISLPSLNKISYSLQKLVALGVVKGDVQESGSGKRIKYRLNEDFVISWRNAKHAFYEKLDAGLLNPLAVTYFEKIIYSFNPNEYLKQKKGAR